MFNKKGERTLNSTLFYDYMGQPNINRIISSIVTEHYSDFLKEFSAQEFRAHDIKKFGKGFRSRTYTKKDKKRYSRNFNSQDQVKDVFVVQRHWNNAEKQKDEEENKDKNKKPKVSYTSNVFNEEKYFGLAAVRYEDGSEELVEVRNLTDNEAETVAHLIHYSFSKGQGKDTIIGQDRIFPSKPAESAKVETAKWHRGLIQSLIRWGNNTRRRVRI